MMDPVRFKQEESMVRRIAWSHTNCKLFCCWTDQKTVNSKSRQLIAASNLTMKRHNALVAVSINHRQRWRTGDRNSILLRTATT